MFTSEFWRELFCLAVKLQMTSAFHPQFDGQSEATNKIIAMYVRCLTSNRPQQWVASLVSQSGFLGRNSATIRLISRSSRCPPPFELVYGRPPPSIRMYAPGDARLPAVERAMKDRDEFLAEVRDRLEQSQQHYNTVYDRCHRPVEFVPGQWVWLRVLHRLVASLQVQGWGKLGPKFLGPIKCWDALVMWPTSWRCRWA
jgi:hypothetical protein